VLTGNSLQASNLSNLLWEQTTQVAVPLTLAFLAGQATAHVTSGYFFPNQQQKPFFSQASTSEILPALTTTVSFSLFAISEHKISGSIPFIACILAASLGFDMKRNQYLSDSYATLQAEVQALQRAQARLQGAAAALREEPCAGGHPCLRAHSR